MKTYEMKNILSTPVHNVSANAETILKKRYYRGEDADYAAMCKRVANAVAGAEKTQERKGYEGRYFELLNRALFLPNSPTWMNANRGLGQLSACFVLPVGDSIAEIGESIRNTMLIHQTGGGTGFSFSRLRQSGALVSTTGGESSGPLQFMDSFNSVTESIKQGGARRGANMGCLSVHHPDILNFIRYKKDRTKLTNFNVSVAVTKVFMEAVDNDGEFNLVEPHTGKVVKTIKALPVFKEIVEYAWENGEPGILYIDEANAHNPTPHVGQYETTNPCGEQWLLPYESCNLGSINLALMTCGTPARINWDLMGEVVKLSIRFLDNVIDVNKYPIKEIADMTRANRKVGLGVMGFADMLAQLGIAYDSEEGVQTAKSVMQFINETAKAESEELAEERGCFPNFKGSIYDGVRKQRNATVTTIAPTGTISVIAGASSGVEPFFAVSFTRNQCDNIMYETNSAFEAIAKEAGFWSEGLLQKISEDGGSVSHCTEVPADVKGAFRVSHDISPEYHVKMQAAFQWHTDNAVSKTVNFPKSATMEDVEKVFRLAYELKTKGITIYRDGSRDEQVLSTGATAKAAPAAPAVERRVKRERPKALKGYTYQMQTGCGPLYVTINEDAAGLFEVFTTMGKAGGCAASQCEAIGRMVSLAWRSGVDAKSVVKQLSGISCHSHCGFGENKITSCSDAVGKAIQAHMLAKTGSDEYAAKKEAQHVGNCPDCGGVVAHESGCLVCHGCGWSAC